MPYVYKAGVQHVRGISSLGNIGRDVDWGFRRMSSNTPRVGAYGSEAAWHQNSSLRGIFVGLTNSHGTSNSYIFERLQDESSLLVATSPTAALLSDDCREAHADDVGSLSYVQHYKYN